MELGNSAGGQPFPRVPTVVFANWREALHQAKLSSVVQAGYSLAITGYLDYCRLNGISVTAQSAQAYMADVQHGEEGERPTVNFQRPTVKQANAQSLLIRRNGCGSENQTSKTQHAIFNQR